MAAILDQVALSQEEIKKAEDAESKRKKKKKNKSKKEGDVSASACVMFGPSPLSVRQHMGANHSLVHYFVGHFQKVLLPPSSTLWPDIPPATFCLFI
jgi:hypothetical protein